MKTKRLNGNDIFSLLYKHPMGLRFADIASGLIDDGVVFTYQELGQEMAELVKTKQLLLSDSGVYIVRTDL